jgi:DNA-3-methyladenine glycosylase
MALLPQEFFARDAIDVARDLLGKIVKHGPVALRITEVEAYRWPHDTANHCRAGRTKRNAPMWGPPGCAYVYLCYGIHHMLNFVTNHEGEGAAVLIRSCEPVRGLRAIRARRGDKQGPTSLTGPGKVGQALALDASFSHHRLFSRGGLSVHDAPAVAEVLTGPRIGIGYAAPEDIAAAYRLAVADSAWVSHRAALR